MLEVVCIHRRHRYYIIIIIIIVTAIIIIITTIIFVFNILLSILLLSYISSSIEALINLGLENRAIAPTLMNATSSRSHTVLTINIVQKGIQTLGSNITGNKYQQQQQQQDYSRQQQHHNNNYTSLEASVNVSANTQQYTRTLRRYYLKLLFLH